MADQDCFVLWPEVAGEWVDSGQGGLFAYLIYRCVGVPERAMIDVAPRLNSPVKPITRALEMQLWSPPFRGRGPDPAPLPNEGARAWSTELRAAMYLGSTPASLMTASGAHLQLCRTDLTLDGDAVAHCLDHVYASPGEILTLLAPKPTGKWWRRPFTGAG